MRLTWILLVVLTLSIAPLCSASIHGVPGATDVRPKTDAPGATLGDASISYSMTPFPYDSRPHDEVSYVDSPLGGEVSFDTPLQINDPFRWTATANPYYGKIYFTQESPPGGPPFPSSMTLTLPENTVAFYLYATTNYWRDPPLDYHEIRATAYGTSADGTSLTPESLTQDTNAHWGATYYGFYADSGESLTTIELNVVGGSTYGFILGEFGIAKASNTPPGSNVNVTDPETGTTISFATVTQGGQTTVTTSDPGGTQGPPVGFMVGAPPTVFNISTTAVFGDNIIIGINYSQISFANESNLRLFHFDGVGIGVDITTVLDMENDMIYGAVSSLSAFAVFELTNQPPVADAGPDQTVEATSPAGASVTLDGSGSIDPDSTEGTNDDIVLFEWYEGETWLGSGETIDYTFPLGEHHVTLVVTDFLGETDDDDVVITVVDTTPPEITCPGDITVVAMESNGVPVDDERIQTFLAAVSATDDCDPSPEITNDVSTDFFPFGDTEVIFTATDTSGNWSDCPSTVTVVEATEEGRLRIIPPIINREGRLTKILTVIRFPEGTTEDDIDMAEPLVLFAGYSPYDIVSTNQRIVSWCRWGTLRVSIFASFSKDEVMAALPDDGPVEFMVVGRFKNDQYFYGIDTVRIVSWVWNWW